MAEEAGCVLKGKKKTNRFYAKILDDPDHHSKLQIPEKFVAEHGSELPEKSVIRLPSGEEWPVTMARSRKKAWFDEGWREFASFNSLGPSHSLMFAYDGHGHFLVFIFDTSASEIDYKPQQSNLHVKEEYVELSAGETLEKANKREKSPLVSPPPQPKKLSGTGNVKERTMSNDHPHGDCLEGEGLKVHSNQDGNAVSHMGKSVTKVEKARALARAKAAFKPQNDSFVVFIPRSYINSIAGPYVPSWFISRYFKNDRFIFLRIADGKVWKVVLSTWNKRTNISPTSWGTFARANGLEVGDVCGFELVEGGEPTLNVVIFRTHQDAHASGNSNDAFTSNQPFFTVVVSAAHLSRSQVYIEPQFYKHIKEPTREAELWVAGNCWGVNIMKHKSAKKASSYYLSAGWREFVKSNSLKQGDVCVFELVKSEEEIEAASREMISTILLSVRIIKEAL